MSYKMVGLFCALFFSVSAQAAMWKKVGEGEMHVLFWHAYDSKLLSKTGRYRADQPHILENTYRMDFSRTDLIDRTFDEMKRHGNVSQADENTWRTQLNALWKDVKEGDKIRASIYPNSHITFRINGKKAGVINDAKFVKLFPAIWLGEKTSEPALRKKLIAKP